MGILEPSFSVDGQDAEEHFGVSGAVTWAEGSCAAQVRSDAVWPQKFMELLE